jgi:hypothetical protein
LLSEKKFRSVPSLSLLCFISFLAPEALLLVLLLLVLVLLLLLSQDGGG